VRSDGRDSIGPRTETRSQWESKQSASQYLCQSLRHDYCCQQFLFNILSLGKKKNRIKNVSCTPSPFYQKKNLDRENNQYQNPKSTSCTKLPREIPSLVRPTNIIVHRYDCLG